MKEKNKLFLGRLLRVLVPLVLLVAMIAVNALIEKDDRSADTSSVYCKATVLEVLIDQTGGQPFVGNQKVKAAITSGEYKGYSCELDNPNTYQIGAFCTEGTRVIALVRKTADGALVGSVYNYDRTGMVVLLLGLFAVILLLVGGWKGAAALYALVHFSLGDKARGVSAAAEVAEIGEVPGGVFHDRLLICFGEIVPLLDFTLAVSILCFAVCVNAACAGVD